MTGLEIAGAALIALGTCGLGWACWAQRKEIERLNGQVKQLTKEADSLNAYSLIPETQAQIWKHWADAYSSRFERSSRALQAIAAATAGIKHGTARKVHRMAREAIDG